jgi:MoaA/NifB/PqqE/SkfB family radical SAM enzyme
MAVDLDLVSSRQEDLSALSFLWLELTGRCNLRCVHCYADSGPDGQPDTVGTDRWLSLLDEATAFGVKSVQFIGGEPTLHRDFCRLVLFAKQLGLEVEIYSNLTHVTDDMWRVFQDEHIALATSFYSRHEASHEHVTRGRGSQRRTLSNIETAVKLGLPLRVGIVEILEDQAVEETADYLRGLGVLDIRIDRSRGVGRAAASSASATSTDQLCGRCADASLAIDPAGWAYPCVFARWLPVGNVRDTSLEEICTSPRLAEVRCHLTAAFRMRMAECQHERELAAVGGGLRAGGGDGPCAPQDCNPIASECPPTQCSPLSGCNPACFPFP